MGGFFYFIVGLAAFLFCIKFVIRHPFIALALIGAVVWFLATIPVAEIMTTPH